MPAMRRFHASPISQPSSSAHSASILAHSGVSTTPGQMQLDVILKGASTWAAVRVKLTTPALLAGERTMFGFPPRYAAIDPVGMRLPPTSEAGIGGRWATPPA